MSSYIIQNPDKTSTTSATHSNFTNQAQILTNQIYKDITKNAKQKQKYNPKKKNTQKKKTNLEKTLNTHCNTYKILIINF